MLTFGSLFAGVGGLDLGLERSGMFCRWQVEIDGYANRVLAKHWPNVQRWPDVQTWPQPGTERVDAICAGFPCQDISYAGLGEGLDGERSGLFFEAVRVVRQLRPRFVVLENVAALLTRGLDRVLGTLAEIGYDAEWHCIPIAALGAPHIRDRAWILAHANGQRRCGGNDPRQDAVYADSCRQAIRAGSYREWWATEPAMGRVVNGFPGRLDQLRCLGNAASPQIGEMLGRAIIDLEQRTAA